MARRTACILGFLAIAWTSGGCSKSDVRCGEGTVLKDGACVAVAANPAAAQAGAPATTAPAGPTAAVAARRDAARKITAGGELEARTAGPDDTVLEFQSKVHGCKREMLRPTVINSGQALINLGFTKLKCMGSEDYVDLNAAALVIPTGETVRVGASEWVVVGMTWKDRRLPSNNQFQQALQVDEGKLLQVQFKVRNLLTEKVVVEKVKLRDSKGRVFEPVDESGFYIPEGKKRPSFIEHAPPGLMRELWDAYHVADDSTDLVLLAYDLGGGKDVAPIAIERK